MEYHKDLNKSVQPRKQRVFRATAPLHVKRKFVRAHLSKELRQKYNRRNVGLRSGDKVTVMRGEFAKKSGVVVTISLKKSTATIAGIDVTRKDGTKKPRQIQVSNVMITELKLDDKRRKEVVEKNNAKKTPQKA
jgi:large subunit ribosomal protein L24